MCLSEVVGYILQTTLIGGTGFTPNQAFYAFSLWTVFNQPQTPFKKFSGYCPTLTPTTRFSSVPQEIPGFSNHLSRIIFRTISHIFPSVFPHVSIRFPIQKKSAAPSPDAGRRCAPRARLRRAQGPAPGLDGREWSLRLLDDYIYIYLYIYDIWMTSYWLIYIYI